MAKQNALNNSSSGFRVIENPLVVDTSATIGTTLGVTGATTLSSTLTVTGNATLNSDLAVGGSETITDNLTVGGDLTISGTTNLDNVAISGNATVGGTLGVTGATTLTSLSTSGNASVGGTLGVTGAVTAASSISASGSISSAVSASAPIINATTAYQYGGENLIQAAHIAVSADGSYAIAAGSSLSGLFWLTWEDSANSVYQASLISVNAREGSSHGNISVLANTIEGTDPIFTDFEIGVDSNGLLALIVSVGNRNGSTAGIDITFYANSTSPNDGTLVDLAPATFTAAGYLDYGGLSTNLALPTAQAIIDDTLDNGISTAFQLIKKLPPGSTAANGIGVKQQFISPLANGTPTICSEIRSSFLNATSNNAEGRFSIGVNDGTGTLSTNVFYLYHAPTPDSFVGQLETSVEPRVILSSLSTNSTSSIAEVQAAATTNDASAQAFLHMHLTGSPSYQYLIGLENSDSNKRLQFAWGQNPSLTLATATTVMEIDSAGEVYANKFNTPMDATTTDPGAYLHIQNVAGGGSDDFYALIDVNGSAGYAGLKIIDSDESSGSHDWWLHVHFAQNRFVIENDANPFWGVTANREIQFYGTPDAENAEITTQHTVTTSDDTPTAVVTVPVPEDSMVTVFVTIVAGQEGSGTGGLFGTIQAGARRTSGAVTEIGSAIVDIQTDATATVSAAIDGTDLVIEVTGIDSTTINWLATARKTIVTAV